MKINTKFYFYKCLLTKKQGLKVILFSNFIKYNKNFNSPTFGKSISGFSHKITSQGLIGLATLQKIKNKKIVKDFILNLFISNSWFSFDERDIGSKISKNANDLGKKIIQLTIKYNETATIITTNRIINSLFNLNGSDVKLNKSIFLEKYFLREKYIGGLSILNSLRMFLLKYFTFFLSNAYTFKKNIFVTKGSFLKNLNYLTVKKLFLGKGYFIFHKNTHFTLKITNIDFYFDLISSFNLLDCLIFSFGFLFGKNNLLSNFSMKDSMFFKGEVFLLNFFNKAISNTKNENFFLLSNGITKNFFSFLSNTLNYINHLKHGFLFFLFFRKIILFNFDYFKIFSHSLLIFKICQLLHN